MASSILTLTNDPGGERFYGGTRVANSGSFVIEDGGRTPLLEDGVFLTDLTAVDVVVRVSGSRLNRGGIGETAGRSVGALCKAKSNVAFFFGLALLLFDSSTPPSIHLRIVSTISSGSFGCSGGM